ncbi:MAG: hypothetical protein RLZZ50_786 [Verrucomicrobiota bacterium]|jgi:soluble cytochrome b562
MRFLVCLALATAGIALHPLCAAPAAPAASVNDSDTTELGGRMDEMRVSFRKLRRQVSVASANASSLELVASLRLAAEQSAALAPARAAALPESTRAAFVADFAEKMKAFIAEVDKLKAALEAGKNDEAVALVARLESLQKSGHREFRSAKRD